MGSWTQFEGDACRLPAGMSRVGYDTDTERYTFQDEQGVIYESEPGNAYGILKPVVRDASDIRKVRPNAFESSNSPNSRRISAAGSKLHSFDEFLPSAAITFTTTTSFSSPEQGSPPPPESRLIDIVLKVKPIRSTASQMQTSKSEGGMRRHSKSRSLLPNFFKSQSSPTLPRFSKRRSRAYSEIQGTAGKSDGNGMEEGLLQSKISSTSGFDRSIPSSWSSYRPTSLYQNASTPPSSVILPEALKISATSIETPMRAT